MFSCQFYRTFNLIFNFPFRNGKYFNANLKLIMYIKLSTVFFGFLFCSVFINDDHFLSFLFNVFVQVFFRPLQQTFKLSK